ncbi:MAG: ABC transporter permease [Oscillospiraceae bacterium]|nr:ABC transporter permease [Oscillospiraceae bacterium]
MIGFLWRKIWKTKWLVLCLIFGNIILIGMVTVVPIFTAATMQRVFQEDLRNVQEFQNRFPAIMQLNFSFNVAEEAERLSKYRATRDRLWPEELRAMGVPGYLGIRTYVLNTWAMRPVVAREIPNNNRSLSLVAPEGFEQHIHLLHGRMPSHELAYGRVFEALASEEVMRRHNLLLGETMTTMSVGDPDDLYLVRIVGIFDFKAESEAFWSAVPITFVNMILVSDDLVSAYVVENYREYFRLSVAWTQVLDATAMRADRISHYFERIHAGREAFNNIDAIWHYSVNFYDTIEEFADRTGQLELTIWVLQIPIYVMLALFMYMVTRKILLLDSNDISVLKSRGASRRQILGIYAMQGLFVAAVSFPLGVGLGVILCHIIGSSSGFLDLVNRDALHVEVTSTAIAYGAIGMAISYIYLLFPVIKLSRVAIVDHKRKKARRSDKPLWQRYFLDVITFAVSLYVLYTFNMQRDLMMATLPDARSFDPMLFVSSSLFIIGSALILLRLYPYFIRLIFMIGRKKFGPAVYASMVKVGRSIEGEQFIMLFLVFTVAVGIFSAQAARTLNLDNAHRIRYLGGADLMIREAWADNLLPPEVVGTGLIAQVDTLVYTEPDFNRFTHFEEVDAITRVLNRRATLRRGVTTVENVTLLGIETQSFGEAAWFRDDLLMVHINYFLNSLAMRPNGVLLSGNFHRDLGYSVGDEVTLVVPQRHGTPLTGRFVVVGFVDFWPSFNPVRMTRLATGEVTQENQFLAVANLGHLNTNWGVNPYQIWMRTNGASHQFIHDFIGERGIQVAQFYDTSRSLVEILSEPIVQSTNGVLTISFIMTMLLCFTGFLIYWILSIKGRLLQFGVFRAMGMGMRGIMGMLVSEQVLITISALIIGGVIGELASRLFVPLVQLSYTAADQVIPLMVVMEPADYVTIYGILGFMLVLCVAVLARYTTRVNISQVLKLGED